MPTDSEALPPLWNGALLAVALACCYGLGTLLEEQFWFRAFRAEYHSLFAVCMAVYRKSLRVSDTANADQLRAHHVHLALT